MKSFPPDVRFSLPWRNYQARVLDELQTHLDDNHLHVVAAPGSGKTVLGLEVVRRLNHPALIFAPTIAIRDQWLDRFVALFCPPNADSRNWIWVESKGSDPISAKWLHGEIDRRIASQHLVARPGAQVTHYTCLDT